MTDLADQPVTVRRPESFEELVAATGDRMLRTAVLLTGAGGGGACPTRHRRAGSGG